MYVLMHFQQTKTMLSWGRGQIFFFFFKDFVLNYGYVGVKSPKLSVKVWIYMFISYFGSF